MRCVSRKVCDQRNSSHELTKNIAISRLDNRWNVVQLNNLKRLPHAPQTALIRRPRLWDQGITGLHAPQISGIKLILDILRHGIAVAAHFPWCMLKKESEWELSPQLIGFVEEYFRFVTVTVTLTLGVPARSPCRGRRAPSSKALAAH